MTRNKSFVRKILYISLMALLLIPLSLLSQPLSGKLDQMRQKYDLSLSSLGDVDPTSETMKLATLGMRGVACAVLWQQREEYKMKQNWEAYAAVNNQISKLQPHFIKVWTFTSWDESYNVSVEFDDYRMRYHWVKKGIDRVIEGTRYNRRSPKLMTDLAWVFGHKLGRSDEKLQFRRAFKQDYDFHEKLPIDYNDPGVRVRDAFATDLGDGKEDYLIDNWLVSREFYLRSIRIAESPGASKSLGQSPVIFFSNPAMASMNYADNVEADGYFEDQAGEAWRTAGREWNGTPQETGKEISFGERYIKTSVEGLSIRLNYLEDVQQRAEGLRKKLDALVPGERAKLEAPLLAKLPQAHRDAYQMPADGRTDEQQSLAEMAQRQLQIAPLEIADLAAPEMKQDALRVALQLSDLQQRARYIANYRGIVNFDYWKTRAEAEQLQAMVDAKRGVWEGRRLLDQAVLQSHTEMVVNPETGQREEKEFDGAKESYEKAFKNWAEIFKRYPVMLIDNPETPELLEHIHRYAKVLDLLEKKFPPPDFKLQVVVDMYDEFGQAKPNASQIAEQWVAKMNGKTTAVKEPPPQVAPPTDPRTATPKPPLAPTEVADPRDSLPRPPLAPAN